MPDIPQDILGLFEQRNVLRKEKKYDEADTVRKQLEEKGYQIIDTADGSRIEPIQIDTPVLTAQPAGPSTIALFGSGELSPTGRRIHEQLITHLPPPVHIGLVETPAGYEDNPHQWYNKLAAMMEVGLQSAKPQIHLIPALRNDGVQSTNSEEIIAPLRECQYIHLGAGSPTYAVRHLKDSLLLQLVKEHIVKGYPLSLASAAAIAFGRYTLPVYEIYKAGFDPYWEPGLNVFADYGLNITVIPHWNNEEGGATIDTSRCFMGKRRFEKLLQLLPQQTDILGIDEQTACIINLESKEVTVWGSGTVSFIQKDSTKVTEAGGTFTLP